MLENERYQKSTKFLQRAMNVIPLGSQTFSKSKTQYPIGYSPFFSDKGKRALLFDIDGNKYVDLVAALGAITVGYADPRINMAIKRQLKNGVTFSLSSTLETEVAEKLLDLLPDAEMVRFAKNGSDVTSAAIRLARHITQKDLVIRVGYHGWHDWYIGSTTRNYGVPKSISDLTLTLNFNDVEQLNQLFSQHSDKIACVILEPMNAEFPTDEFLSKLRKYCDQFGSLLIFDEVVTGFRISKHGASQLFKVKPDVSCFGKGVANGFPLSAIVGKRLYMQEFENVFFSGTFGGETLSLVAANTVLDLVRDNNLIETLSAKGLLLNREVNRVITALDIDFLSLSGHPSWTFLKWNLDGHELNKIKTLFLQEMLSRGVLVLNTHNIIASLTESNIKKVVLAYSEVLPLLKSCVENKDYEKYLKAAPIQPLFKIR